MSCPEGHAFLAHVRNWHGRIAENLTTKQKEKINERWEKRN
jgi:hypothetical protein